MANARGLEHTVCTGLLAGVEVQEAANIAFDVGFVTALLEATGKQHLA